MLAGNRGGAHTAHKKEEEEEAAKQSDEGEEPDTKQTSDGDGESSKPRRKPVKWLIAPPSFPSSPAPAVEAAKPASPYKRPREGDTFACKIRIQKRATRRPAPAPRTQIEEPPLDAGLDAELDAGLDAALDSYLETIDWADIACVLGLDGVEK